MQATSERPLIHYVKRRRRNAALTRPYWSNLVIGDHLHQRFRTIWTSHDRLSRTGERRPGGDGTLPINGLVP